MNHPSSVASHLNTAYAHRITKEISMLGDNPDVGNRSSGSEAERQTARIIENELKGMGFEQVHVEQFTADTWSFNRGRIDYRDENGTERYAVLGGFATHLTCNEEMPIVYAGRGTEADYAGLDVTGKAVLIDINQAEDWWAELPAYEAHVHGAKCAILCNVAGYATWDGDTIGSQNICGPAYVPTFSVSQNTARTLRTLIELGGGEASIRLDADSVVCEGGNSQNVWAEIPGETDEAILFFAHYDGYYHSFFDDAQGVGSVLALARAFKESGYTPNKTLRFILHGAEEWGRTNREYDWSVGAFRMINELHPEWANTAFVILNIDGMHPVAGHTTYAMASPYELQDFVAPITCQAFEGTPYTANPEIFTGCWTEDFSYVRKGIPAVVASHAEPRELYHGTAYHSTMDSDALGVDDEAWGIVLKLFTDLTLALDAQAVRPMAFTSHFKAMEQAYDGTSKADFSAVFAASEALDAKVQAMNRAYAMALAAGDTKKASAIRLDGLAFNQKLHAIYFDFVNSFFGLDYEDNVIYAFEMNARNVAALTAAIRCLQSGDGAAACDEYLPKVDYNRYALPFSEKTYGYMLSKMNNAKGTWGEGMIRYPGENLWSVIHAVAAKKDNARADYAKEIAELQDALKHQSQYRQEIERDFTDALKRIAGKMEQAGGEN
jgi:Iap family predicted aminopeptidase